MKRNFALSTAAAAVLLVVATVFVTLQISDNTPARGDGGSPPAPMESTASTGSTGSVGTTGASSEDVVEHDVKSFNPYPFYSQSCSPNEQCVWDVGTMRSLTFNDSPATQVGIAKGVEISWNGQTADAGPSGRCSLVVLAPNSWFENLTTTDANVTLYNVYTGDNDVAGWTKTIAVQAAQEQSADYGCPMKSFPDDFDIWSSDVESPPCEVIGFECTDADGSSSTQSNPDDEACETLDCKERKATADFGGKLSFREGDAVAGYLITLSSGEQFTNCFFDSAPSGGTVIDGVVHPRKDEVNNLSAC